MANLVRSRKARAQGTKTGNAHGAHSRLAAGRPDRSARRDWNKRGHRPLRFARLRAALSILEKRQDGHHVVAYDPTEREAEGGARRAQRRSPRGREAPRQTRGRRVMREGEEDLEEVVRTSRRRAVKTEGLAEGDVDKIQIEVGAVSALQARHGVKRGAFWIVLLSLLLFWIPILGPAVAGYVGGRKAGTPLRAAIAALIPIAIAFGALAALAGATSVVPAMVRHAVEAGAAGVLGSLPFDFPILGYVLGNLAAIMNAGPDALFSLLAFALAGGAMTQMKVQERMVPPITARIPASRVVAPLVQAPARAIRGARQAEVDGLVAKLNDALARAEKERKALGRTRATGVSAGSWSAPRSRFAWLSGRGERGASPHSALEAQEGSIGEIPLSPTSRQVVAQFLASTPSSRGERRVRVAKAPEVDLSLPQTIAFAGHARGSGAEGRSGAHLYRPSKQYHIYGGSVNPVARAKLEKRLRRTHTLHAMRRGARSLSQMVEVDPEGARALAPHAVTSSGAAEESRPRSLEASALTAEMHYDALEHLENAKFESARRRAAPSEADDLGGLIAHLGEGGEAVVDEAGVDALEFSDRPVFDRRGRQRARIADDDDPTAPEPKAPASKPKVAPPALVRKAIDAVEQEEKRRSTATVDGGKSKVARSADRADPTAGQSAKVDRWLKRTIASAEGPPDSARGKPKGNPAPDGASLAVGVHPRSAEEALEAPSSSEVAEATPARRNEAKEAVPAFEITHGSTEVDSEAAADEGDAPPPRHNRSASDILREIRLQKKADRDAEEGEEIARSAKHAKEEADEIERHARGEAALPEIGEVVLAARDHPARAPAKAPSKKRRHDGEFEPVETDAEKLGSDLEMTLAPIRDEEVRITELVETTAEAAPPETVHASVDEPARAEPPHVAVTEVSGTAPRTANLTAPEPERDVKPGEMVLAGPSTDAPLGDSAEAELTNRDQERIRKRLQEGWNRL